MSIKLTIGEVIKRFRKVHWDKYDYSMVDYENTKKPVKIICLKHGAFFQQPMLHWNGAGCPKCHSASVRLTPKKAIERFKKEHGERYDYSKAIILNSKIPIKIICKEHGIFMKAPADHWRGTGCPKCKGKGLTEEDWIKRFNKVHENKFSYPDFKYKNAHQKLKINCPIHGIFYQDLNSHVNSSGCPKCAKGVKESKGEKKIKAFLEENNINYIREYKFKDCKNIFKLPFDFFLPKKNILIEYDGQVHFKAINYFGGEEALLKTQKRDKIKTDFAKQENIKLIRIPYWDFNNIEKILKGDLCLV